MHQIPLFAVAVESCSSGLINWFTTEEAAQRAFDEALTKFGDLDTEEINLFTFEAPAAASPDEVTEIADTLMWEREYTPLRSHNQGASIEAATLH